MNAADRARVGNRIVTYLGKWLASVRPDGIESSDAFVALDAFTADPLESGEPGCYERLEENRAYCKTLTPQKMAILALLIERAAARYAREFEKEMGE